MRNVLCLVLFIPFFLAGILHAETKIDRKAVVERHNIKSSDLHLQLPLGNGNFCVTVDGTGLQTFGGNIMSHDAWHTSPLPEGFKPEDVPATGSFQQGRCVPGQGDNSLPEGFGPLRQWMFDNPHIANLGRIRLMRPGGVEIKPEEIAHVRRTLDLWNGIHTSTITIDAKGIKITTFVYENGGVGIEIISGDIEDGSLELVVDFPCPNEKKGTWAGDFHLHDRHSTHRQIAEDRFSEEEPGGFYVQLERKADDLEYPVQILCERGKITGWDPDKHSIRISGNRSPCLFLTLSTCKSVRFDEFIKDDPKTFQSRKSYFQESSQIRWNNFWQSGAFIDLSESTDPRWRELERRIVLSQYLLRCNTAGSWPSAESGLLTTDPWRGQFHMEMVWWHLAHYALWDRLELSDEALKCYEKHKPVARQLAEQLGYKGYKWGKSIGPEGRTAPWSGNQILLWKQPHPIFFAELEYRNRPGKETLEKWTDIIEGTAENMADYVTKDADRVYHLDPVMPPSEQGITRDTVFDLAYWRWGLDAANRWRERMNKPRNEHWDEVRKNLALLPTIDDPKDGRVFVHSVDWLDTFTKRNWEHPDPVGVLGMLPPIEGVDGETARRTVRKIAAEWQWNRCWGWDFPWIAMAAARVGEPELAVDMLLHESSRNHYDERGVCTGGPCPYLPGNGGLLYAVALMAAGWDDGPEDDAPGFPKNGQWKVRHEGLKKAP